LFLLADLFFVSLASSFLLLAVSFADLGADALEDGKAALGRHSNVEGADIGLGHLVDSRLHNSGILAKQVLIACPLLMEIAEVTRQVAELAAHSILAEALAGHVALAERHAELAGDVSLLHEFVLAVGECALKTKFAVLAIEPELANFSLLLLFICGLENGHVVRREVLWLSYLLLICWHPEGRSSRGLEDLGCGFKFSEGCLHHRLGSKEAFALGLCEASLILNFFLERGVVGRLLRL